MEVQDRIVTLEEIAGKLQELEELALELEDEDDDVRRTILAETQGSARGWMGTFVKDEVAKRLDALINE